MCIQVFKQISMKCKIFSSILDSLVWSTLVYRTIDETMQLRKILFRIVKKFCSQYYVPLQSARSGDESMSALEHAL